jgi:polyphosphate kinase
MSEDKPKTIARDISWLSFNARVLQEAADESVPLRERIRFLGIFSNNMDEFFRVRVATLKRMMQIGNRANMHLETNPQQILDDIQMTVLNQQSEFARIWENVQEEMREQSIFLVTEKEMDMDQQEFVRNYFEAEVSPNIIPLMIENIPQFPHLRDKSIYLAIVMWKKESALKKKYALIEIPSRVLGRFLLLPSKPDQHHIILLEDIVRFSLPEIFSYFGYDQYHSHVFKVTRDAELEIDNDLSTNIIQKIEKGLKNRRKGKPVRFVYDKEMDPGLLEYLTRRLNLSKRDNLIPGGRIHNFRHFMDFPDQVFKTNKAARKKPFDHPMLVEHRVSEVVLQRDIMLHFPYHSFTPLIDIIREAAFDPDVTTIKITCYRMAAHSRIINALINAVRNGKEVVVMLELRARFDEEANLEWKSTLEDEGAKVLVGLPNMKVHSKICMIRKKVKDKQIVYGFVSTGNLNEKTARVYGDHCLLTSNQRIMNDVSRIFNYLEHYKSGMHSMKSCETIIPSPQIIRKEMYRLMDEEIKQARKNKPSGITLKMNSLSDEGMIAKLNEAARAGVPIRLIIRGILCMLTENKKFRRPIRAISIIDEYLEHARVWVFHNRGKEKVYISSADWMLRNLEHRVEATCPILDHEIKKELIDIINIQLQDNVKARWLDNDLSNEYVRTTRKKVRAQVETYNYLYKKTLTHSETGSH